MTRRPRVVLALALCATCGAAPGIPRLRLRLDARALVPDGDPELARSDTAAQVFDARDTLIVGVSTPADAPLPPSLIERACRLGRAVAELPQVEPESLLSVCTLSLPRAGDAALGPLVPSGRLTPDVARRVWDDVRDAGLDDGVLVARDGAALLLVADVHPAADRAALLASVERLAAAEPADSVHLGGNALAQAALGEAVARDLARLVPAVLLVMGVWLSLAFASPLPALIALLEIGVSLVVTLGAMGFAGQSVFVTTLVLPVILIAVGVSDDVYVLQACFDHLAAHPEQAFPEAVASSFRASARSVGLTTLSTCVGLVSLAATGLEPLRVFGLAGAAAIAISTLCTFTLVPALLVALGPRRPAGRGAARQLRVVSAGAARAAGPRTLAFAALLLLGCAWICARALRVDDAWVRQLPASGTVARGDAQLNARLAGTTTLDLLVDSGRPQGFAEPQTFAALGRFERALAASPLAGAVIGVHDDVLRLHAALAGRRLADWRAALVAGDERLDGTQIALGLALRASASGPRLSGVLDGAWRRTRVRVILPRADYTRVERLLADVNRARVASAPEFAVQPFGDAWISHRTVALLVRGQVAGTLGALLLDFVLVSAVLGSVRAGTLAVVPVAVGLLAVLAGLAATHTPLGIANSMFTGISLGVGLDFCIHFCSAWQRARGAASDPRAALRTALEHTAPAIVISALAIAAGFLTLTLSSVAPTVQLGWALAAGLVVCAAATLFLVPSLVLATEPRSRPRS